MIGSSRGLRTKGFTLLVALSSACSSATSSSDAAADSSADVDVTPPPERAGDTLPCGVATVLARDCSTCHYPHSTIDSTSIVSRDDLLRMSRTDPTRTVAQVSLDRMNDATNPMPPLPAPHESPDAIAALQQWIDGGMQSGTCALPDPLLDTTACPSSAFWTGGDHGSAEMHPGQACLACHRSMNRGPQPVIAGTVFPVGHATDDCNAFPAGSPIPSTVDVEITDANGAVSHASPNASGNFVLIALGFARPYTARIRFMGRERRMLTPQTEGDCNSCHTSAGQNAAPGRITLP